MKYNYADKEYNIPEDYIAQQMKANKCSREEACELWLCDNGIDVDPEQEAAIEATKGQKIGAVIGAGKGKAKKDRKPREKKVNEDKVAMVQVVVDALTAAGYEGIEVVNNEREVNFIGPDGKPYRWTMAFRRNDSKK